MVHIGTEDEERRKNKRKKREKSAHLSADELRALAEGRARRVDHGEHCAGFFGRSVGSARLPPLLQKRKRGKHSFRMGYFDHFRFFLHFSENPFYNLSLTRVIFLKIIRLILQNKEARAATSAYVLRRIKIRRSRAN